MTERVVVIGGDAAGGSAASQVRRGKGDDVHGVMVERGRWTSYSACGIPYWVAGDVLELAADRLPVEEIARRASLSAGTVRNYLSSAASKLGAANRHEAVHVTHFAGGDNPLATLPAFGEFQRELARRCVEQPAPSDATVVGSYGRWP